MPKVNPLNDKQLAEAIGTSERNLSRWRQRGFIGTTPEEALEWKAQNIRPRGGAGTVDDEHEGSLSEQLMRARVRVEKAKAAKLELENKLAAGKLAEVEVVQRAWLRVCATIRSRLEALPFAVIAEVPAECRDEVYSRTGQIVYACLLELSEGDVQTDDDVQDDLGGSDGEHSDEARSTPAVSEGLPTCHG